MSRDSIRLTVNTLQLVQINRLARAEADRYVEIALRQRGKGVSRDSFVGLVEGAISAQDLCLRTRRLMNGQPPRRPARPAPAKRRALSASADSRS